jgi:hypothetical protein
VRAPADRRRRPTPRRRVATTVAVVAALLGACSGSGARSGTDVVERAATALHVDADLARYTVDPTADGGVLAVGIDDQFASTQIERAREFLRAQQTNLARGDVRGLRAVLGAHAAGLAAIARGHRDLRIAYVDEPDGGQLELRSTRPDVVRGIHQMLDDILTRFGKVASVPDHEPSTTLPANSPSVPSDFLG